MLPYLESQISNVRLLPRYEEENAIEEAICNEAAEEGSWEENSTVEYRDESREEAPAEVALTPN